MGRKTISLDNSAYRKLNAAKRRGESFSDAIRRVLGVDGPSLLDLRGLLDREAADRLADTLNQMRREDLEAHRPRLPGRK